MKRTKFLKLAAALMSLLVIAAACGGGDDDGGTGTGADLEDLTAGGILRVAGTSDVDYMDPASMYYTVSWWMARGIFRTLVTYPTVADIQAQNELVPDLATDTGTPNDDNTEWTYTLKDGVMFGQALGGEDIPGVTGEQITSADVKYGVERMFLESVGGGYPFYYDVIEGVAEFQEGNADEVTGIETPDDKTIVFKLSEPVGDWPFRMAMPATAPVPEDYASQFDSKKDSDYDNHVIATGPYFVEEWTPGERITLRRNTHWDEATDEVRAALVDGMDWKLGFDNDVGVQKVLDGDFDLAMDVAPSGPTLEQVVTDPDLSQRFVNESEGCTRYVYMNTSVEPFDDPLVREAVNLAIDRENLVRLRGGQTASDLATSIIPPGINGYLSPDEYNPFETPNMAGDIEAAKQKLSEAGLADGFDDELLFVGASDPPHDKYAESVRKDLEELGFSNLDVKLPAFPNQYTQFYSIPDKNVAIGTSAGWCKDYNDAFTFFDPLFHGDNILESGNQNYAELNEADLNAAIDAAAATPPGPERDAAWQEVNKMASETAVWVPWSWDKALIVYSENLLNPIYVGFVSHVDWVNVALADAQTS